MLNAFDTIVADNADDKFAGIFSIRYCQAPQAYLSMHSFGPEHLDSGLVCNIEIGCLHNVDGLGNRIYGDDDMVGLKDGALCESSSQKHMVAFEQLVTQWGARLHWGQISFTNIHNPKNDPNYSKWREIWSSHSQGGSNRLFDSDFTARYQISACNTSTHWAVVANSLLPGAATVAPADAAQGAASMPPTAFLSAQDCLEIVVAGSDGQVCWTRQPAPDQDLLHWSWVQRPDSRIGNCQSGNVTLAPQLGGRLAIGVNSDSHPEVFAWCASDTGIYHAWRNLTDSTWNNWTQLNTDTGFAGAPDAALAADGTLVVAATTSPPNLVRWTSQNSLFGIVGWNDWGDLPGPIDDLVAGSPSVALGGDGLLHSFVTTQNGFVRESIQSSPAGSSAWGDWTGIGQQTAATLGNLLDGQHLLLTGDFTGAGHQQVLLYNSGDGNWWLADSEGGAQTWTFAGNTAGFGNLLDGQHQIWVGHFDGSGPAQVMFYYAGDSNWWLGVMQGGSLSWSLFDNTAGFGNLLDGQHEFFTGDFIGEGIDLMLFYYAGDGNWWLRAGSVLGFGWVQVGNTAGFGNLLDGQHPFWTGDFTGAGHQQVLFYYSGDGNWWLGDIEAGSLNWTLVSNGSGFIASAPGIGINSDGTLELFAVKTSGQLYHIRQSRDLTWNASSWEPVIDGDLFTISNADRPPVTDIGGIVHVAAMATDGTIVHYQQQGSAYVQQSLGGVFTSPPAITADSNGLPAIFAKFANDMVQQWHPEPTRPNLFAYDPRAGAAELYSVDAVGNISLMQTNPSWLTGYWLGVAGRFAGTDLPTVLVYDSSAATASFYTFDDQGNATQLNGFSWGTTWSRVACGNFTGGPFDDLVFYDPVNGVGEFYITDGQGNMSLLKRDSGWRNSWSAVLAANFTGGMFNDLLLYDPQAGEGELYTTDGHGNMTLLKSYNGWRGSWTHILTGHFTGSRFADLLFYDEIAGYAELYSTDGQGNLTLHSTFTNWQGWTFAVSGHFTGQPFSDLFLYNPVSATGELYTSDGSGNLTLLQIYTNWPHYWGIVLPLTERVQ